MELRNSVILARPQWNPSTVPKPWSLEGFKAVKRWCEPTTKKENNGWNIHPEFEYIDIYIHILYIVDGFCVDLWGVSFLMFLIVFQRCLTLFVVFWLFFLFGGWMGVRYPTSKSASLPKLHDIVVGLPNGGWFAILWKSADGAVVSSPWFRVAVFVVALRIIGPSKKEGFDSV